MSKLFRTVFFLCSLVVLSAAQARADSIGPDCSSCQGSIYTLDIVKLSDSTKDLFKGDNLFDTYQVILTIDTSGYDKTLGGVRIDEVAVKISGQINDAKLVSVSPNLDLSTWQSVSGQIGNNGCTGTGSGFQCADWKTTSSVSTSAAVGGTYTWVFNIDIATALYAFNSTDPNLLPVIKVRYVDGKDAKVGSVVSETVPEPTTLALLGVGLSLAAIRRRRG